ncbi:unnamed protein product [Discula destructiva]
MSSSTFGIHPSLLDKKHSRDGQWLTTAHGAPEHISPTTSFTTASFAANNLSPYSHVASSSNSPINNASTPAESLSAFSEYYPSSDLSDHLDPFFGVDFDDVEGGTPSFLEDPAISLGDSSDHSEPHPPLVSSAPVQSNSGSLPYPINTSPKPSTGTNPPRSGHKASSTLGHALPPKSSSHAPASTSATIASRLVPIHLKFQSGPETNNTITCSDESPTSTTAPMPSPSPRVTVSMWGRDQVHEANAFPGDIESPATVRAGRISADDNYVSAPYQRTSTDSDEQGSWMAPFAAGPGGWAPESRPTAEGASINELKAQRKIAKRNQEVDRWRASYEFGGSPEEPPAPLDPLAMEHDGIREREIPLGTETENKPLPGQVYYTERSGPLTEDDWNLMGQHRAWADAPTVYRINDAERTQPETAQAAMQRFEQMCQETGSVLSRAATWGTRRRSLPSIADIEGVTSGNFLKKLSMTRERKPSIIFKELRGLMRKPSAHQLLKRHRTVPEDDDFEDNEPQPRRESRDTLAPPGRTTSWAKRPQRPSLNTALVSMATGAAAIGTTHARTGSISNVTSPKSPFFKNVRRPRSRSELPKVPGDESQSNLAGMWKKSGGPPVAHLARGPSAPDVDEDEDDEDDLYEEGDTSTGASSILDNLTPNLVGFKQQVLQMNPALAERNTYLVDRIAHQQVVRYKDLQKKRIEHIKHINAGTCPSGHMCIGSGDSAVPVDVRADSHGVDPRTSTHEGGSDNDALPLEGGITAESFPADIPMPPTASLPAEFECQLCYTTKKFTKPSDWTKHVHEDVQPFTCTWDRCREPKIFKRKADWVRHENEGHRHLEWWTCDVEECRHTCYRRDNFLQHLVREHKFPEPKIKTKAAVKKAGANDPTWQKVEKCHADTHRKPQDEPCRFCGKTLPTWKKLTVHLAKHMEIMSLPILRLVAREDLGADTIISPVQDPVPRNFPPVKSEPQAFEASPDLSFSPTIPVSQSGLTFPVSAQPSYVHYPTTPFPSFYDSSMQGLQQPNALNISLHHQSEVHSNYPSQTGYQTLPESSGPYLGANQYSTMAQPLEPFPAYTNPMDLQSAPGNQMYDTATLDPSSFGADQQQYSHQGSVSPYSRSPHHSQGGFFHQQ